MKKYTDKRSITLLSITLISSITALSQGNNWKIDGNSNATATTFIGSTTNQPFIMKTNNIERFRINGNGQFYMLGLGSIGSGFLTTDASGLVQRTQFTGNANQVLLGNGTFGTLPSSSYFTLNGVNQLYTPYKLGVGVLLPTEMLEVNGNGIFNGTVTTQEIIISDVAMAKDRLLFRNSGMLMEGYNPVDGTRNEIASFSQPLYINSMSSMFQNTIINSENSGKVGIGTTTPQEKFDLAGNAILRDQVFLPLISEELAPTHFTTYDNLTGQLKKTSSEDILKIIYAPSGGVGTVLACKNVENPTWANGYAKIFVKCPDVKVGIGLDNPSHSLTVNGNAKVVSNIWAGSSISIGADDIYNSSKLFIVNPSRQSGIVIKQNNNPELYQKLLYFEYTEPTTEVLKVFNTDGNYSPIIVRADGSIDIDNGTRKIFKLHAGGILQTREVWVDANNWPDYVFTPSYNLKPLSEVKTFIQTNGHLPNVPSAEEVKEKGVNLAENDKVLLEKVEELTLYLIQLEERLAEQEKTIQQLQNGQSVKQSTDKK